MERVTGIGGIFFKCADPKALGEWYRKHLGIDVQAWLGAKFTWQPPGETVWGLFPRDTTYFDPTTAPFMINYRVANLDALLAALRSEGVAVDERTDTSDFGKFGWATDPEGNRFELWEPPAPPP